MDMPLLTGPISSAKQCTHTLTGRVIFSVSRCSRANNRQQTAPPLDCDISKGLSTRGSPSPERVTVRWPRVGNEGGLRGSLLAIRTGESEISYLIEIQGHGQRVRLSTGRGKRTWLENESGDAGFQSACLNPISGSEDRHESKHQHPSRFLKISSAANFPHSSCETYSSGFRGFGAMRFLKIWELVTVCS
ncbi:hypothetical protein CDAR_204851 [Caerostris darwini]|uniref:Uncharacterized protein n=1 Tax=Caerostris darwini TaxID=1538125 RepID=A0AAV4PE48_9ARAC|nr:hypothetical protein CDAR_204851 [Caerostris darwini]